MAILIFPLLFIVSANTGPDRSSQELSDFSRFYEAIGRDIAIIDRDGVVREGTVTFVSHDAVSVSLASGPTSLPRDAVASAERLRDRTQDGAIKGAIVGALIGAFAMQGFSSGVGGLAGWVGSIAIYSGIGWAIDAAQTHREPIYRSAAPAPVIKLSLRF